MITKRASRLCGLIALFAASVTAHATELTGPDEKTLAQVDRFASSLASELASRCPLAEPGSQAAFDTCRDSLYHDSVLRQNLPPFALWGRQRDPKMALKDTSLTQFAPDVLAGMYLPLFMFNGKYTVGFVESEGMYQIRLQTAFRNRLTPGQFPYPFWHDADKWTTYQNAKEILLWWDSKKDRIRIVQFTAFSANEPLLKVDPVARTFGGQWLWTDEKGRTQPMVTVFDGLFKANNPYVPQLDSAYKALALRLREGQCNECHVPNNPDKSRKLVLLQTPAHAGAEIKRLIKAVRDDRMPRDNMGIEQPLAPNVKADLLRDSEAFDKLYDAAKAWEATTGRDTKNIPAGSAKGS